VFFGLAPFEERTTRSLSKDAILGKVNGAIQAIQGARMFVVPPPAVDGLGNAGGFKLQVQDRGGQGEQALYGSVWGILGPIYGNPKSSIGTPYSNYDINVPQLFADVDRTKAKQMGLPLQDIYDTLADQPRFAVRERLHALRQDLPGGGAGRRAVPLAGREHHQPGDAQFGRPDGAARFGDAGQSDLRPDPRDALQRLPFGRHQRRAKPGFSSGQAEAEIERMVKQLPRGMSYEWTDLTYQDRLTRSIRCRA
jgi:multidrug efflux pump